MTREEAIKGFEDMKKGLYPFYPDEYFDMAIKALEQDPPTKNDLGVDCISRAEMLRYQQYLHGKMPNEENYKLWEFIKDLPSVTPQEPILNKIRVEILNEVHHILDGEPIIEIKEVLQILDKYKAEVEPQESEVEDGSEIRN